MSIVCSNDGSHFSFSGFIHSVHVVSIGSTWAEHRVFGLSMMVYGKVNPYVMNTLGKAVMAEDLERKKFNLLKDGHWRRFYVDFNVAVSHRPN